MWYKLKRILIYPDGVTEKQVRPWKMKTATIVWNETSDPTQFFVRYEDDAAGLTPWDTAFDEFFWYYACRLASDWTETGKVEQSSPGTLDITQLWDLSTGDNVMIAFPVMWIKMSKSWSQVTLSITKELNKSGYQYYAHTKSGTLDNPWTPESVMYLWAYGANLQWRNDGDWYKYYLNSKSWLYRGTFSQENACAFAKNNGNGWNICWFYQRQFINCLYMMKYWNPNCQSVVWPWAYQQWTTWWTNSQTDATYWTNDTTQIKLFWIEDRWWWEYEWVWWAMVNWSRTLLTSFSWWSGSTNTWDYPLNTWAVFSSSSWCVSSVAWTNYALLIPIWVNGSNYNTYYCDYAYCGGNSLIDTGVGYSASNDGWIFYYYGQTNSQSHAAHLMYL